MSIDPFDDRPARWAVMAGGGVDTAGLDYNEPNWSGSRPKSLPVRPTQEQCTGR
ncbi:hypothetical protein [Mycobacterium sp. DBP42]|uniref:hypothetical protein n=1 Tax=Mycobacterium sp. DBP42 TaxID=2545267 RepID=UPI00201736F8|nr:hypothetical protein [Mycobacterium sp. DBP42]